MITLGENCQPELAFANTTFFRFFVTKPLSYYKVYSACDFFFLRLLFGVVSCYFFYLVIFIGCIMQQISYPVTSSLLLIPYLPLRTQRKK